ncbi:MAG TPA: nucleotide-binding protein [Candidatus Hydrogenedentes bacterium]|nr:nucleotide-binding protein [Candidatus Hydrogenedentota bacterium]
MKKTDTNDAILELYVKASGNLVKQGASAGHWGDVRSTALACWALHEMPYGSAVQKATGFSICDLVADARHWLVSNVRIEEDGGTSWESEAWDTALSVIGLVPEEDETVHKVVHDAVRWLESIVQKRGAWYDEPWETSLSAIAMLWWRKNCKASVAGNFHWLEYALTLLCSIPPSEDGYFISPHYTGFIVWLHNELTRDPEIQEIKRIKKWREFQNRSNAASNWLIARISGKGSDLWSCYTFSNAYILHALARAEHVPDKIVGRIVRWFKQKGGKTGLYEDNEDTALAALALGALLKLKGGMPNDIPGHLISAFGSPISLRPKYFIGYCGSTSDVAVGVKDLIREDFKDKDVQAVDWKYEFYPGKVLIEEIEEVFDNVRFAVFLFTKDHEVQLSDGKTAFLPSGNISYETGYFAGAHGREQTIMVVEEGVTLPSDLHGVIHVHLKDRNSVSSIRAELTKAVKKALRMH